MNHPMNTTQTTPQNQRTYSTGYGTTVAFDSIQDPGAYICRWSGHLLRVPEDGLMAGRSPAICVVACETPWVTKISDNPYIARTKARMEAANYDLPVNF